MEPQMPADKAGAGPAGRIEPGVIGAARPAAHPANAPGGITHETCVQSDCCHSPAPALMPCRDDRQRLGGLNFMRKP